MHGAPSPSGIHPFSDRIEAAAPAGKLIHAILDTYAVHKHPKVRAWPWPPSALDLSLHPNLVLLAPGPMPAGERGKKAFDRLQRGVFHSLVNLQAAINRYLAEHNNRPNPLSGLPTPTVSSKSSTGVIK
jgi:hypothetical protein